MALGRPISPKQRPDHEQQLIGGWIRAGLQRVVLMRRKREGGVTRMVNKTGCRIVLRSKYRDVWEGARFTLAPGESALLCWTPDNPYERLGAFVDTGALVQRLPLLIGQSTLACNHEISFLRSPSNKRFSVSLSPRRQTSRPTFS